MPIRVRFALRIEVMMHGAARQQRADRHALRADGAVRQDDQAVAVVDRLLRLGANAVERCAAARRRLRCAAR